MVFYSAFVLFVMHQTLFLPMPKYCFIMTSHINLINPDLFPGFYFVFGFFVYLLFNILQVVLIYSYLPSNGISIEINKINLQYYLKEKFLNKSLQVLMSLL